MNGRNLFESRSQSAFRTGKASTGPQPGVFISHSRLDRDKAREVVRLLKGLRIDYYFDEGDEDLRLADQRQDHTKVVDRIEAGLKRCSHLLGVLTQNTRTSWWVPYEIGGATGRQRHCAHLIDGEVDTLPSYIQAATILPDRDSLQNWLPKGTSRPFPELRDLIEKSAMARDYPEFVPASRKISELRFE
jgi:hypothetical protein